MQVPVQAHGSDALAHHAANIAAIAIPVGAWLIGAEPYLAAVLTLVGFGWYAVLFHDRFLKKKD